MLNIFENGFSCKAKPWQEFKRAFSQSSGPAGGARLSVELRGRTGMRAHTCGLWALLDWDEGPMRLCQLHGHQACPHAGPRASEEWKCPCRHAAAPALSFFLFPVHAWLPASGGETRSSCNPANFLLHSYEAIRTRYTLNSFMGWLPPKDLADLANSLQEFKGPSDRTWTSINL